MRTHFHREFSPILDLLLPINYRRIVHICVAHLRVRSDREAKLRRKLHRSARQQRVLQRKKTKSIACIDGSQSHALIAINRAVVSRACLGKVTVWMWKQHKQACSVPWQRQARPPRARTKTPSPQRRFWQRYATALRNETPFPSAFAPRVLSRACLGKTIMLIGKR
eukprot:COSAG06_NODE_1351_length_9765_cov_3.151976_7_plen_166_part_00